MWYTSEVTITVTVVDDITPTPVCDEITQIAIGGDGTATVLAETFDDGSNDNCGIDFYEVRRMTDNCDTPANLVFGESVTFCCADIDESPLMVEFRVVDFYGNANTCMVEVLVEDKLAPTKIADVNDDAIDCDNYFNNIAPELDIAMANGETNPQILIDLFGQPVFDDNCSFETVVTFTVDVNTCGEGTITRTWTASDSNGSVSCDQTITVNHVNDWEIDFPADETLECVAGQDELDGEDFGEPNVYEDDCELIAISSEDQVFSVVPDACYKVIRTWTAINWCVYDGDNANDDTLVDAATRRYEDGGDGIVTYIQTIKVQDDVAPAISVPSTQEYCIDGATDTDGDCDRNIELPEAVVTDCSDDVTVTYTVVGLGTGRNYTNVAPGTYEVTVTAIDNCGNQSTITYDVVVRDCKLPTPYCVAGLVVELMPIDEDGDGVNEGGMVEIWANDFNAGSFDNCTAQEDLVFTATIGTDDFDAATTNLVFDCDNVGSNGVYIYVTDEAGNTDYCLTTVNIESVDNVCPQSPAPSNDPIIAGAIMTEMGDAVELTEVHVNGNTNEMMMTTENGQHATEVMDGGDSQSLHYAMMTTITV